MSKMEMLKGRTGHLFKTSSWYNPFSVRAGSGTYQLNKIHFYNEDGVVYKCNRGWFDSNNAYDGVQFDKAPALRRAIKFDRDEVFIVSVKAEFYEKGRCAEIYIPMHYLEEMTYEIHEKEYTGRDGYEKDIRCYVKTPCFQFFVGSETSYNKDEHETYLISTIKDKVAHAATLDELKEIVKSYAKSFE